MVRGKKKSKTTAGFTLVELLVTMLLLMIIAAPIMAMFVAGSQTTMASNELTSASLTAQLRMEELVGLTWEDLCKDFVGDSVDPDSVNFIESSDPDRNGFAVKAEVRLGYEATATPDDTSTIVYNQLAEATVIVMDKDGNELCRQINILNVA